ncbi:hypothetical protein BCR35DRAFT_178077 [Leucosporidium creatinivorum]|uniref:DUF202 domain-containing protein n=1 Tax=Leucosporidium creatinivorum TaxID=106004 RepID=A0A1Y2G3E4_9BASI|nr:hypothetical protein BCR35DRAFT_178077 [Leucosporidium creatinivorum]
MTTRPPSFLRMLFKGYPQVPNTGSCARDHLANERTSLAWMRSSLALVALGIGLERFETLREDIVRASAPSSSSASAASSSPPQLQEKPTPKPLSLFSLSPSKQISLLLCGTGAIVAIQSTVRYYQVLYELQHSPSRFTPNVRGIGLVSLMCFGVFGAVLGTELRQRED